ncbi:diguanylate cyclase [Proteiniclasticum sp. C24MP]|uniref:sensor domain-containing diguanylate cyclase n=1 Tax=Proteiniclasticum sp. C24MP TaxID=3374101 RepID=UPI0037550CBF
MKNWKVLLFTFIFFLFVLTYAVEGIHFENEFTILIFASALGLLINYFRSYHTKLQKPMMTAGSFLVVIFAMSVLGRSSSYGYMLYLFPLTVATFSYGLKGGLGMYAVSLLFHLVRSRFLGEPFGDFLSDALLLGTASLGPIYISIQLHQLIHKNEAWLGMLHMKINEMSLLREITASMQGATDLGKLDKIVLSTLTAGYGLGFNRALLFLVDGDAVYGEYAIGPSSKAEAYKVWGKVVTHQINLHDVIENHEDTDVTLLEKMKSLRFSLKEDFENPIVRCCLLKSPMHITGGDADAFGEEMKSLMFENYALVPLMAKNHVVGVFLVDNRFNEKPITDEALDSLITFAGPAALAFDNTRLSEHVRKLAVTDELTRLYNHRFYKDTIQKLMKEQTSFFLMVIDVDDFKHFNETYGHATGDRVLSEVGTALRNAVGTKGTAFRYGGDEFTIILPGATREETLEVAQRIQENISDMALDAVSTPLTISIGVAEFPDESETEAELFITADRKLSFAKGSGKNTVTWEVQT